MSEPLEHSGGVAFRAPLLPLATVGDLTGGRARAAWTERGDLDAAVRADREHLDARLRVLLSDPAVRAAVAYASLDLDDAVERWLADPAAAPPRGLLGYVARMSGRSVPFGLFAGCAAGDVEGEPAFRLGGERRVRARVDARAAELFLARLDGLAYVPNSTLHATADRLRLVERVAEGVAVRYHPLAIEDNDAVRLVLDAARPGRTPADLAQVLVDDEVTYEDAYAFVTQLAEAQLLVPDVAAVTGGAPPVAAAELRAFEAGPGSATLRAAVAAVRAAVPDVPRDRAVHVDMARPGTFVLGDAVLAEARRAVRVLHPLFRETSIDTDLAAFKAAYAARYGDVEMPLLSVLDPEAGIGYGGPPALASAGAPLLRGFNPVPSTEGPAWTPIDHHLVDLLSRALRDRAVEIDLGPADLGPLRNQRPRPLPPSLAVVATVAARSAEAVAAGEFRLVVHGVGGPNAVALFSRFAPIDEGLDALARRHVEAEERRAGATFAEVVHLPERRAANVAVRPVLRAYEIPLLTGSAVPPDRRVALADLTVSVGEGRVVLRDAAGREVLPRLSAAHDHVTSTLPLYRFLAAVQQDATAGMLGWSWGSVDSAPFLPRVVVGRLVLAPARWRWFRADLRDLTSARTPVARYAALQRLREAWDVPRWATLVRGTHEIPVDLDGVAAAELLAYEARRAGQMSVGEQLPAPDGLCLTGPEGAFAHEFVLPLHGPAPVPAGRRARPPSAAYVPGSEWLDVSVFCGPATADAVLREVVAPFVAGAPRWSYERHADPAPHLRLRVEGDPGTLLPALRERLAPLVASGRVADVRLGTYRPAPADAVAHADSVAALRVVSAGDDLDARWRAAFWGVDRLLADAGLDDAGRRAAVARALDGLAATYGETAARARRLAGRTHRARRGDLDAPDPALAAVLDDRSRAVGQALQGMPEDVLDTVCAAHLNRLLRAAHDVQRVVVYDLLDRRYRARTTPRPAAGR